MLPRFSRFRFLPVLKAVKLPFTTNALLYKSRPLRRGAQALLVGSLPGESPEPVAWIFARTDGGRTFHTSLGSVHDFENPSFNRLLYNGIRWAAGLIN